MPPKRKAEPEEPVDSADELLFFGLGGCNEVGRSCHILKYRGKTVMLDAGLHPVYDGYAALPFYDEYDLSTVDVLLISHFHFDHAASLPYVLAKTNFKGRVFMTHPTKAIYKWLIQDSVRVGSMSSSSEQKVQLYTEADHFSTFPMIEAIDYYTTHTVSSIRITPYPAGHVLGAAMFLVEIAGLKILFTGDYSREEDRHLVSAVPPANVKIDVLITESTYGIASHTPRMERENMLMKTITGILNRGGRALLPVFALGRAQELLLILDEYWSKHPEYQNIPIYYASNLARKCMIVYQTYVSAMNDNIRRLFKERMAEAEATGDNSRGGPWDFQYVRALKSLDRFEDVGPCVMLASPGMMQSGISRGLLERWAPDPRNGVVITGYSVEGTMAKMIVTEPEFISAVMTRGANTQASRGRVPGQSDQVQIPRRCSINEYPFAAHVDGNENREFVEEISPAVVILVHGDTFPMTRLKSKLLSLNSKRKTPIKVFSPLNCEELRIPFKSDKIAKVVGKLAEMTQPSDLGMLSKDDARLMTGVLVQNDFKLSLMAPEDLKEYAGLMTTQITCRHRMKLHSAGPYLIRWALEGAFGHIDEITAPGGSTCEFKIDEVEAEEKGMEEQGEEQDAAKVGGQSPDLMVDAQETDKSVAVIKREPKAEVAVTEEAENFKATVYEIMNCVRVRIERQGDVEVEWEGNMVNDGVADAVVAVLMTIETSPAAIKVSSKQNHHHHHDHHSKHSHDYDHPESLLDQEELRAARNPYGDISPSSRLNVLLTYLEAQFGETAVTPLVRPRLKPGSEIPICDEMDEEEGMEKESMEAAKAAAVEAEVEVEGEKTGERERNDKPVTATSEAELPPRSDLPSTTESSSPDQTAALPESSPQPSQPHPNASTPATPDQQVSPHPPANESAPTAEPEPAPAPSSPKRSSPASRATRYYNSKAPLTKSERAELERLHSLNIPVPGIEIRVDDHVARVWLEDLSVECDYGLLTSRVKAVVERGIEMGAALLTSA